MNQKNIFMTSPTNSGKTLPALIFPSILSELHGLGHTELKVNGKVLFLTALHSIQMSMISSARSMNIKCESVTESNVEELMSSDNSVLFIGPEVMKSSRVTKALMKWRNLFVLKVVDEVHLCMMIMWLTEIP